ncbi:unnamed protein product, partial [Amoebophrya sp. A25]
IDTLRKHEERYKRQDEANESDSFFCLAGHNNLRRSPSETSLEASGRIDDDQDKPEDDPAVDEQTTASSRKGHGRRR